MAVHIVDLLEAVHVDHQDDKLLAEPLRVREGALGHFHEVAAVVEPGQPVGGSELLVPDREPPVIPQSGELPDADQRRQQNRTQQDTTQRVESDVVQSDDHEQQVAPRDRQVRQRAGPRPGRLRRSGELRGRAGPQLASGRHEQDRHGQDPEGVDRVTAAVGRVDDDVVVGHIGRDEDQQAGREDPQGHHGGARDAPPQQGQHAEQQHQIADGIGEGHEIVEMEAELRSHGRPEGDVPDHRRPAHEDRAHIEH